DLAAAAAGRAAAGEREPREHGDAGHAVRQCQAVAGHWRLAAASQRQPGTPRFAVDHRPADRLARGPMATFRHRSRAIRRPGNTRIARRRLGADACQAVGCLPHRHRWNRRIIQDPDELDRGAAASVRGRNLDAPGRFALHGLRAGGRSRAGAVAIPARVARPPRGSAYNDQDRSLVLRRFLKSLAKCLIILSTLTAVIPVAQSQSEETITLNFKDADIDSVVGAFGHLLNKTFVI